MKKKAPRRKAPKPAPACHCKNPNPTITSLFQEVFEADDRSDAEDFHEALGHSEAFGIMVDTACEGDMSPCCLIADAVRYGWKAGQRAQECKSLEAMVSYE